MKLLMSFVAFFVASAAVAAEDPKTKAAPQVIAGKNKVEDDKEKDAKPKLGIGDAAPKLIEPKWLKGDAVTSYDPRKVYVLEFWATWCGPCISAMPHLSELAEQYKGQGLVVVGVTSKDENNTLEKVNEFMTKKGQRMRYAVAFFATEDTDTAFMKAAGQDGIPCSFVIDRAGKIAYIGHPMNLDDVLPKVLNGTWKGQADIDAIDKLQEEFFGILGKSKEDPDGTLKALAEFDKKHPSKANWLPEQRFLIMVTAKKWDEVKTRATKMIADSVAHNDAEQASLVGFALANAKMNPDKKHVDVAVKAAETALKLEGENDTRSLLGVAEAHFAAGSKQKAIEYGEKALKSTDEQRFKDFLEKKIKTYKGETNEEKKAAPPEKKQDK